ncbi:Asp-tRNA(Asn)/Glu-tRNA(Gln) amidotransferase subunit GatC [Candidatus Daviesbacteria bacterium]|nr:Asp-tRNA(Asn)/Glu-tRNA(Gln) amidotransferase subunit GatC [Candidatus Daviesbacteria bacterium]
MKLTREEVKRVAKLANLPLTEEQEDLYSEQLSKILDYIDLLNQVETSNIDPTYNISGNSTVTRTDETVPGLTQEEALANAPKRQDGFFVTKGVFSEN